MIELINKGGLAMSKVTSKIYEGCIKMVKVTTRGEVAAKSKKR